MIITPKNWRDFQHYKDRSPPWIRLHKSLLDNQDFNTLPPMACKVLVLLWLVASDNTDGAFDDDPDKLAFRLRLPAKDVRNAVDQLMRAGFLLPHEGQDQEDDDRPLSRRIAERNGFGSRHISDATKREVWERDGGKCTACASDSNLEYDHIHPVSKGGDSNAGNVQLLCRPCNRKKRTKTAEQVATPAQPWLDIRTTEAEALQSTETETERESRGKRAKPTPKVQLPEDFGVSVAVGAWAAAKGYDRLGEHLDAFRRKCKAKGYAYADWDAAFQEAVREDWAKLRGSSPRGAAPPPESVKSPDAERSQAYLREQAEHAATAVPPPPNLRALVRKMTSPAA